MALSPDAAAHLRALAGDGVDAAVLARTVEGLLDLVLAAAPSCLGVSLTVHRHGLPVTVTVLAGQGRALGSLTLRLPAGPGAEDGPVLVLWSGRAGSLAAVRRDWLTLLELDPDRAVLDADLALPPPGAQQLGSSLADTATVDRALGVLLEHRGLLPAQGRAWLVANAPAGGSVLDAARALLHPPPATTGPRP